MRSSDFWEWRPCDTATLKKWCGRVLACGALLALLTLAAGMAAGGWNRPNEPAAPIDMSRSYSSGGNLIPVF